MTKYEFNDVSPIRSKTMSAIRGKNTSIELILRKELFRRGYRYRIHYNKLPGSPDIVFVSKKIVVFCDSEFWHGKNLKEKKRTIKNNKEYWINKITRNIERDKENTKKLISMGWIVLRFWETDIKNRLEYVIKKIESEINKSV